MDYFFSVSFKPTFKPTQQFIAIAVSRLAFNTVTVNKGGSTTRAG